MGAQADLSSAHFTPRRPASRRVLVLGLVLGSATWLAALIVAARVIAKGWAVEIGLLVAALSFVVAFATLLLLRAARNRQARRYAARL